MDHNSVREQMQRQHACYVKVIRCSTAILGTSLHKTKYIEEQQNGSNTQTRYLLLAPCGPNAYTCAATLLCAKSQRTHKMDNLSIAMEFGIAFAIFAFLRSGMSVRFNKHYMDYFHCLRKLVPMPSGGVFMIVWTALFIFLATAMVRWADTTEQGDTAQYAVWSLFILNVFLIQLWYSVFFIFYRWTGSSAMALVVAVLLLIAAVVTLILFTIESNPTPADVYVLWGLYIGWLFYAMILNILIYRQYDTLKEKGCFSVEKGKTLPHFFTRNEETPGTLNTSTSNRALVDGNEYLYEDE